MVHSCTVESSDHQQPVEIIDEFGCPRDAAIPSITYLDNLTAGLRVDAFSLEFEEVGATFRRERETLSVFSLQYTSDAI